MGFRLQIKIVTKNKFALLHNHNRLVKTKFSWFSRCSMAALAASSQMPLARSGQKRSEPILGIPLIRSA